MGIKENPADFHFIHYVSCCYVYPFFMDFQLNLFNSSMQQNPPASRGVQKRLCAYIYVDVPFVCRNNIRFNVQLTLCLIKIKGVRSFIAAELVRFREIATYVLRVFISD